MEVKYRSNNSGGHWWLSDKDWKNLEKAGWYVLWGGVQFCYNEKEDTHFSDEIKPAICKNPKKCNGHRKFEKATEKCRWLGGLVKEAQKDFKNITEAMKEFEKIIKQDISDEGCNCCGPPHSFIWGKCHFGECKCKGPHKDMHFASGEECLQYLFPDKKIPSNLREVVEGGG